MRILLAALAGAVAMFVWTAIAHMATPLGRIGFEQIPNEAPVLSQMQTSIGGKDAFYIFPWVDPNDPQMMQKYSALEKSGPSGMLLYRGAGHGMGESMTPMLVKEFSKQFVESLIFAWIVSMIAFGFSTRVMAVTAMGLAAGIATNISYWNWYGFPFDYTMAQIVIEVVSALVAGLAIAFVLSRRTT
ncbi:MAG: hypothetical protein JOZ72_01585 [Alphaproteobacteria bacterium]|nr:hypothetical protein [Alphaproteobacteria bacterium]